MKNMTFSALAASIMLLQTPVVQATPTTFVHLFEWNWQDIANECETFLGPKGYAAVQVSPPNEHIVGDQWWTRYQPVSYQIQSRGGDREAFANMVRRCQAVGVDIYVDAVINHMAAGSGVGVAGNTFANKQYPIYSPQDFHETCAINGEDYGNNPWRVQHCELVGLADLDTASNYVQDTLAGFLNDLVNLGVKGMRLDASKHMPSSDIASILAKVNGAPLIFQEVIDQGSEAVSASEYFNNGLVTEFKYSKELGRTFKTGKLAWLSQFGQAWGMMPSNKAVVFVDNHDNQRGHGGAGNVVTFADGKLYELANVFMLAYPYGYPKVMSSYNFHHDTDAGGPTQSVHQNGQVNCTADGWQCEHRKDMIAGAVDFRNNTASAWQVNHWWDNGNNQIAFSRGTEGFVAINREASPMQASLQTGLAAGQYCDVLSGSLSSDKKQCSGAVITVNNDGVAFVNVSSMNAIAIHNSSRLLTAVVEPNWQRTAVLIKAQTQNGQDMFIRGGIDHQFAASIGRNCDNNPGDCSFAIRHNNWLNPTTSPWKQGDTTLDWQGAQPSQSNQAQGSPLDWTTNLWPTSWGSRKTVGEHGYGETPLNTFGAHYWLLDVQMDCSNTVNGWFELKAFVKNGQGWEGDIEQANAPYISKNHFAQCGKLNVFEFGKHHSQHVNFN